ncbi:flagellar biosynthesis anti-sigma factor FlgM [Thiomicrospira microaerophila]|uniref:flagellar biosynthesis anti-sigma factor FlgM n=1 Tax=Thiomicrospira microaerophila TaxID=406020 RepID=UPI0005C8DADE|nr:flagellar biosynthesis anti-sigma factor FlgM [Thiomicrospira microaerophila]
MDIKNLNSNLVNNTRLNENSRAVEKTTANAENTVKAPTDKVTLTPLSSQIRDIEKRAHTADTSNEARIAELKKSINDGSYKINADSIADKLIRTELLLARA